MDTQKMVRLSLLVSLATVLSILENQLPIPRPLWLSQLPIPRPLWLRLGLANVITLVALMMYGTRAAVTVACMRALLAGVFGALPMLAFSFPAALTSSLSMGLLHRVSGQRLSIIGLSISGAVVHNIGLSISGAVVHNLTQLLVAYFVLSLNRSSILALAPLLVLAAVGAGFVTGLIAGYLVRHLFPPSY
jgi:heptaprenyl diphosphate synthase